MRFTRIPALCFLLFLIAACDRETNPTVSEPLGPAMDASPGDTWTLTMYYWDNGWVRLGAIDGGFLPADLRIGINAHNWGPLHPGFWAEFDDIRAYGDIDLQPGVIEDFDDGSIESIWDVPTPWWDFSNDVARATIPPGSSNGNYHIAGMNTWRPVVHGEFDVQVDFTLDPAFHTYRQANVMLCFWDEPFLNGVCATHASRFYGLWRGTAANLPEPLGFHALRANEQHLTGKLRVTRTRTHKGPVVESVSGSGSFTTAQGDWRTFSFSARRHADGTVYGQWERLRREAGNAADSKSRGIVTCFAVVDNQAWIGGVTTMGLYSTPPHGVGWRVVDNSESAAPDGMSGQYLLPDMGYPAWYCARMRPDALSDIEAGNINIRR